MTGNVVVGIDDSEASRVALRWAADEAAAQERPLEVVHAWREPMVFVPNAYPPELVEMGQMEDAARSLISGQLAAVGIDQAVVVTQVHGYAPTALLQRADDASLVVVGRHGAGGHPLLGSTAEQVARHAPCPVAVVPTIPRPSRGKIIVGVDGSEPAATALRWAVEAASRRGATLEALLAWSFLDQIPAPGGDAFDPHYVSDDALVALNEAIADALGTSGDGPPALERQVVNDLARNALVDASDQADLVVVGRRGLGGFRKLLVGSVSRHLLERSHCPTVVVTPRGGGETR